jgi:OOP family OmpA-OmpF porin
VLADHPELLKVEIQGHTDERNTDAYNLRLSQRRAETVRKYLIKNGISETRLTAKGYGESQPVVRESNEAAWYQNRRVVFQILERAPEPE